MLKTACLVAALALACLLVRAARVGIAGDYIDPVGKVAAADEARYADGAVRMAHGEGRRSTSRRFYTGWPEQARASAEFRGWRCGRPSRWLARWPWLWRFFGPPS